MSRHVIAVRNLEDARDGRLVIGERDLVTPLAAEEATARGIRIERAGEQRAAPPAAPAPAAQGPSPDGDALTNLVRSVITSVLAKDGGDTVHAEGRAGQVKLCRQSEAVLEDFPFAGPGPDQRVQAVDVVTSEDGPLAAGYLTLTAGTFPWTLTYDEVQVVLEGELHIGTDAGVRVGRAGDVLYVPKGSAITFGTPSWAKFVYVTFPSNWAEGR